MKKIIDVDDGVLYRFDGTEFVKVDTDDLPDYVEKEPTLYPEVNTEYWFIDEGRVLKTSFTEHPIDYLRFDNGIAFLTRGAAEFECDRRKIVTRMKLYTESQAAKWDGEREHWLIQYDFSENRITYGTLYAVKCGELYFATKSQAQRAVEAVGEDNVKKYYLGVIE